MKNKKGQLSVGGIIMVIMAIIVGLVIIQAIFGEQSKMINTANVVNESVTLGGNGVWVDLTGQNLIGSGSVNNYTYSDDSISAEFREGVSTTSGVLRVQVRATNATWANKKVNVTYTYGAEGYVSDSGGRAIAGLIGLMSAITLVIVVAYLGLREYI